MIRELLALAWWGAGRAVNLARSTFPNARPTLHYNTHMHTHTHTTLHTHTHTPQFTHIFHAHLHYTHSRTTHTHAPAPPPPVQVLFEDIQDDAISLEGLAEYWLGFSEVVKDPAMIFQAAWRRLSALVDGEQNIRLPHEIMFLGGAPGAGKGTMTPYVMWERGITAKPIVMSSVLNSPSAQKIINAGGLVGDMEVRRAEGGKGGGGVRGLAGGRLWRHGRSERVWEGAWGEGDGGQLCAPAAPMPRLGGDPRTGLSLHTPAMRLHACP